MIFCLRPLASHNSIANVFLSSYGGSGPAQLALALLADHLADDEQAVRLHQKFKFAVIVKLPKRDWTLTSEQIKQALQSLPR